MEIRQVTEARQVQTLSPQFILSQRLLQLTSMELVQEIEAELTENPALELIEVNTCPYCHMPMSKSRCENCGRKRDLEDEHLEQFISSKSMDYDRDGDYYEESAPEGDDDRKQIGNYYEQSGSFHDYVMSNFLSSDYPPELKDLGEYLIYSLDDEGFLIYDLEEIREKFDFGTEEVDKLVEIIKTLDPPGVGAQNAREALLIQLAVLAEEGKSDETAELIIRDNFEKLGRGRYEEIAESLGITVSKVHAALDFIRRNLNPYPARSYVGRTPENVGLAKPSIAIKYDGQTLSYEVLEMNDFQLQINRTYLDMYDRYQNGSSDISRSEVSHIRDYFRRAKFFLDSINQRKQTLEKIATALCEEQRDFLIKGLPNFNSSLTQGKLAEKISLHESTVSRAMSAKFVQLPKGEIVSFDFFFDSSVRPKEYIRNIIATEAEDSPVSDSDIKELLKQKGIDIARRTVAKYREEMGIASSFDRRRVKR